MYGPKRVVLTEDGKIVLAGKRTSTAGGNWHPIGKWHKDGLSIKLIFLLPEHMYCGRLTLETADVMIVQSKAEARERIADIYA